MTTETERRPAREPATDVEARLEEAVAGIGHRLGWLQALGGGATVLVVGFVGALLARSYTVSDQITALTERTAVTEQKVTALQSDVHDIRNEVRAARDELTELRVTVASIATKIGATPEHPPPPTKPEEP
jgi:hypothetical protein